jgi:hypothetical protein
MLKNTENSCQLIKKPKGQTFFSKQTRNKKAKIELFGHKKAKLPTLNLYCFCSFAREKACA